MDSGPAEPRFRTSLNQRLIVTGVLTFVVFSLAAGTGILLDQRHQIEVGSSEQAENTAERLSRTLAIPLWIFSREYVDAMIDLEISDPSIMSIQVRDSSSVVSSSAIRTANGVVLSRNETAVLPPYENGSMYRAIATIRYQDETLGTVEVRVSDRIRMQAFIDGALLPSLLTIGLCLLIIASMVVSVRLGMVNRIIRLSAIVRHMGAGSLGERSTDGGSDEIGELSRNFNTMAAMIEAHTTNLEAQVRNRTRQLVETEKVAFMGRLVAGFSHELNTPLGVCMTAASYLEASYKEFQARLGQGSLTRAQTEQFVKDLGAGLGMVMTNLGRATELVTTFKNVGTDQSSMESRLFNLKEYMESVLLILKPKLKHSPHQVSLDIEGDIMVNASPGLFYQVFSQLLMNSLVHAWPEGTAGNAVLRAHRADGGLELTYSDDGRGIPSDQEPYLFTPLNKKELGGEGLGLGLYIAWSLVHRAGGTIRHSPGPAGGAVFHIHFPQAMLLGEGSAFADQRKMQR